MKSTKNELKVRNNIVPDRAHFLSSSSFIKFQTVEFEYVSSSNSARVFRVLPRVIRVFQIFQARF